MEIQKVYSLFFGLAKAKNKIYNLQGTYIVLFGANLKKPCLISSKAHAD